MDILTQTLLILLTLIALQLLRKVSICCARLLFSVCYFVNLPFRPLRVIDWSHFWWANFESVCLLMIFTYFNSKFQVTCKKRGLICRCIKTHLEERSLKNVYYFSHHFAFFSHQTSFINLPSWVICSLFSNVFQMVYSSPNKANLEFTNLKHVS